MGKINIAFIQPLAREVIGDTFFHSILETNTRAFLIHSLGSNRLPNESDMGALAFQLSMDLIRQLKESGVNETMEVLSVQDEGFSDNPLLTRLLRRVKDQLALRRYVDTTQ